MADTTKNILVIGSGGREHALCWKLAQSQHVEKIYCLPGNAGTARCNKTQNVEANPLDFEAIEKLIINNEISLIWVGPENPLSEGIVDYFQARNIKILGPVKHAAQLETSKAFAKQFITDNSLPSPRFGIFDKPDAALDFCKHYDWARVIKVDGLALGKGVYVCDTLQECQQALNEIFTQQKFGASGTKVVVEEKLTGKEASLICFCDGQTLLPMPFVQDHKRRFENDQGPNTGGMGAFSPLTWIKPYEDNIVKQILIPLEKALQKASFNYVGMLFIGLMFNQDNEPMILEFNCRFGDPEAQCLLPLLKTDLLEITEACLAQKLSSFTLETSDEASVCVVVSGKNYPEESSKDKEITILPWPEGAILFHAGTVENPQGKILTNGGRLLSVVGLSKLLPEAKTKAYAGVDSILFEDKAFRRDIAATALVAQLQESSVS